MSSYTNYSGLQATDIEADSDTSLNNITNQLLLKYDDNFNSLYTKSTNLDRAIMNKEELIFQNMDYSDRNTKAIYVLYYTIGLTIIYFLLFTLHATNRITTKLLWVVVLILFLFYLLIIYYRVIYESNVNLALLSYETGKAIKNIPNTVGSSTSYKCPTCPGSTGNGGSSTGDAGNNIILDKQSSENVWLYGDKAMNINNSTFSGVDINDYYSGAIGVDPKPFFQGISKLGATYYKCDMKAPRANADNGIGIQGFVKSTFSTIPCTEMNGFEETAKYICTGNANGEVNSDTDGGCTEIV